MKILLSVFSLFLISLIVSCSNNDAPSNKSDSSNNPATKAASKTSENIPKVSKNASEDETVNFIKKMLRDYGSFQHKNSEGADCRVNLERFELSNEYFILKQKKTCTPKGADFDNQYKARIKDLDVKASEGHSLVCRDNKECVKLLNKKEMSSKIDIHLSDSNATDKVMNAIKQYISNQ